ncbi:thiaminase II [Pseudooceanicola sp. CBS1P-1]|uniref:Aminopyrimidine aminohydrolase n=1 Tax=Pseudooceanicola albus TaxID=2692189 RepID=A0A6L7G908_9RHOB|nr:MULTISPECIES: thiaminase II [Pseudooceanicola]MBT9382985.1 thiaminase II [Pseudooceanicola endophyticus]MXN19173.1 thiaminase II [Pseudooceanicola albus]
MSFTDDLWTATAELQQQIAEMPFNRDLAAGTLPPETFRGYIIQDAHYLEGYARVLALAAARAPDAEAIQQLAQSAGNAIAVERGLHAHYMGLFGVSAQDYAATGPSQACDHYVSYLAGRAALGDFPELLAAILPCFWIYHEIGQQIATTAAPENPYRAWIDTYAGEAFAEGVRKMLALVNRTAGAASPETRARMHAAFARASWHEWHFWDSAHHRRGWAQP